MYRLITPLPFEARAYTAVHTTAVRGITSGCDVPLDRRGRRSSPLSLLLVSSYFCLYPSMRPVRNIILGFEESNISDDA